MRKKDLSLRVHHPSGAELPLDAIEFLTTYPGHKTRAEIIESTQTTVEKYQSPKLRQIYLRNNHNELEKSRRAQLKTCLENLSEVVPMGNDTKQTTLGLLTRSRRYIKFLEEKEQDHRSMKEELMAEQQRLKSRLEELQNLSSPPTDEEEEEDKLEYSTDLSGSESDEENMTLGDLSYIKSKVDDEEMFPSNCDKQLPHILKDKGFELAAEAIGTEINLADAEGYCLLLDNIDMMENFTYDHELGRIIIRGQLRREDRDDIEMVQVII